MEHLDDISKSLDRNCVTLLAMLESNVARGSEQAAYLSCYVMIGSISGLRML